MITKRLRFLSLRILLVVLTGAVAFCLLTPRTDKRIHLGMNRVEVETMVGEGGEVTSSGIHIPEDTCNCIYACAEGFLLVSYHRNVVTEVELFPESFWWRVKSIFHW
jgi:hypothetical protein